MPSRVERLAHGLGQFLRVGVHGPTYVRADEYLPRPRCRRTGPSRGRQRLSQVLPGSRDLLGQQLRNEPGQFPGRPECGTMASQGAFKSSGGYERALCRDWIAMRTSEAGVIRRFLPRSLAAFLREAHELRLSSERSRAMLWSRHVNRPLGAIIARGLLATSVSPNCVSIVGVILDLVGAALVLTAPVPAPVPLIVVVFVVWQLALTLDNTDGLLARARRQSSPFGAWLDQIFDFVGHSAVIVSLTAFVTRAFAFRAAEVAVIAPLVLAGSLIGLFASAQRNALLGTQPALRPASQARLRIPFLALHLTDFGLFLALASVGLAWPPLLLVVLALNPVLTTASVAAQVAINWPRGGSKVQRRRPQSQSLLERDRQSLLE
jgi:phosphatidylglycerophosphate synthase